MLGNLEESILLITAGLQGGAYGVNITEEYNSQLDQDISLSAVHTVLRRLENKGMLESSMGGASNERGGRRKRLYKITPYGYKTLEKIQTERKRLWLKVPKISFS